MYDAVHHQNIGKCSVSDSYGYAGTNYRKRRQADELDAEFEQVRSEMDADFAGKAYSGTPKPTAVNKLEALCRKYIGLVWNDPSLADCPKLGAWENRSDALLDDLTAMKNICLNDKGGSFGGGGNSGYDSETIEEPSYNKKPSKGKKPYGKN
jgi:GTPase involved in cell partitioning and DNA repair